MRPIAPARAIAPILAVMLVGAAIMFARARYVESCWVPILHRLFHNHCVVPWIFNHKIDILAYAYIATAFSIISWLALRTCEDKTA